MNMKRKVISLGIIITMLSAMVQTASAKYQWIYTAVTGWDSSYLALEDVNWQDDDGNVVLPKDSYVEISRNVKFTGNAALHYRLEKGIGGFFCQTNQKIEGFKNGAKYHFSAMVKTSSYANGLGLIINGASSVKNGFEDGVSLIPEGYPAVSATGFDWTRVLKDFTYTGTDNGYIDIGIIMNWAYEGGSDFWIDDLMMCEVMSDGDYGENMIKNPGFEDGLDLVPPKNVSDLKYEPIDSGVCLTWQNPTDDDYACAAIYKLTDDGRELICETDKNYARIDGLKNGREYTLLVCSKDNVSNESDGVRISVRPVADPWKIKTPAFTWENGILKATVQMQNNRLPEDTGAEIILAVYKDGCLWDFISAQCAVPPTENENEDAYVSVTAEIPAEKGGDYSAELFIWNSLSGIKALYDNIEIE